MEHKIPDNYHDEAELIKQLIEQARSGKTIRMLGLGDSMKPLLKNGRDSIELAAIYPDTPLKKGDVVLYLCNGVYVLHRIIYISGDYYSMLGDGNLTVEPPLHRDFIYLKAVGYIRNGKYVRADAIHIRLYGFLWRKLYKHRPFLWKMISVIHKFTKATNN